jgi:transposase
VGTAPRATWRAFGGYTCYVVLDNLKEGVIKPDLYEPALNPLYAALLAHYGVVADPCRVRDPNRKGTVENAIQHRPEALRLEQQPTCPNATSSSSPR